MILDVLDLIVDRVEHRKVVVDDEIENGVDNEVFALREAFRARLAAFAHMRIRARCAMAHAHDIAGADKNMRLAEGDAALNHLRGARDDENAVFIFFELRKLMRLERVLDREMMQRELFADALQQLL